MDRFNVSRAPFEPSAAASESASPLPFVIYDAFTAEIVPTRYASEDIAREICRQLNEDPGTCRWM